MPVSTFTRRAAVGALAAAALTTVALTAPPTADAMERVVVCVSWRETNWTYLNEKGEEVYVSEARCNGWMDFTTGDSTDLPPKGDGSAPGGYSGEVRPGDKAYCDYLEREADRLRQQIAMAQQRIGQARADLASYAAKAGADHAEVLRTRAELDQARAEYEDAKRYYEANNDTEVEREVKAVVTITVRLGVNPWGVGARALSDASDGLNRAQQSYDKAWDQWSQHSGLDFQAAQRLVDSYTDLIDNGPMRLEDLYREKHGSCP